MSCRVKQGLLQLFPVTDSIYRYSSIYVAVDDGYWEFFKTSKKRKKVHATYDLHNLQM